MRRIKKFNENQQLQSGEASGFVYIELKESEYRLLLNMLDYEIEQRNDNIEDPINDEVDCVDEDTVGRYLGKELREEGEEYDGEEYDRYDDYDYEYRVSSYDYAVFMKQRIEEEVKKNA